MEPIKLRLLNQFAASEPLNSPDEIECHFPYETNGSLVKRMTYGAVKVLNDSKGEISVELTPFEVQGLPLGDNQNFSVKVIVGSRFKEAVFTRALNVRTMSVDGEQRKFIVRKK